MVLRDSTALGGAPALKNYFPERYQLLRSIHPSLRKNCTSVFPKNMLIYLNPAPSGGTLRPIVTNVGDGMRWTLWRARRARPVRPAKSCGPDPPTLGSSFAKQVFRLTTVARKARTPGRSRISRNTIAQGRPGRSGRTCGFELVCFLHCTRGRGCARHPAFPAPSVSRRAITLRNSGRSCRGNADVCPRHCERSEAIQTAPGVMVWIASSLRSSQ